MPWDDAFIYSDAMLRFAQGEMARVHSPWYKIVSLAVPLNLRPGTATFLQNEVMSETNH